MFQSRQEYKYSASLAVSSVCVCGLPIWQAFYTEHGCFHCTGFLERGDFVSSLYWNTKYKCTMFCPLNESSVGARLGGTAYSCFCLINPHQHTVDWLAVSQLWNYTGRYLGEVSDTSEMRICNETIPYSHMAYTLVWVQWDHTILTHGTYTCMSAVRPYHTHMAHALVRVHNNEMSKTHSVCALIRVIHQLHMVNTKMYLTMHDNAAPYIITIVFFCLY